jgi:predicted hydrocarbon binding protein
MGRRRIGDAAHASRSARRCRSPALDRSAIPCARFLAAVIDLMRTEPARQLDPKHLRAGLEIASDLCRSTLESSRPEDKSRFVEMWVRSTAPVWSWALTHMQLPASMVPDLSDRLVEQAVQLRSPFKAGRLVLNANVATAPELVEFKFTVRVESILI